MLTASENGNANMEVEIARGTHPNLRSRLEEVDNKQKQTASKLVQTEYEAKRKRKLEDLEPEVLSAIEGGEGTSFNLLSEPQDESVTGYKTVDTSVASKTKNLFDKRSVQKGGYLSASTGNFIENSDYTISDFIPVEQSTIYRKNYDGSIVFYDAGRNFISGLAPTQNFTTPNNAHFVRTSLDSNVLDSAMLSLRTEWSSSYEPYLPEYKLGKTWDVSNTSVREHSFSGDSLDDVFLSSKTENIFNKENVILNGYISINTGNFVEDSDFAVSRYIPIEPSTSYRKSFEGSVVFYDKDKKLINGLNPLNNIFFSPEHAVYVKVSLYKSVIDTATMMKSKNWTSEYVPYSPGYRFGKNWNLPTPENQSRETFLRIPTPYHDGTDNEWSKNQTTHPSVEQFDERWNGYKYWMVHTPYPHANEKLENPCIATSNNGIDWVEPDGINNPLAEPTTETDHLSDEHIFYNEETDKLEVWYRENIRSTSRQQLYKRTTSSDGINWSAIETMFTHTAPPENPDKGDYLLSPSVDFNEGKYKVWFTNAPYFYYMESTDGKSWNEPVEVFQNGLSIINWHSNVVRRGDDYHLFILDRDVQRIHYATSTVGNETSFSARKEIITNSGLEWELDGQWLYRATPLWLKHGVMVIYGTISLQSVWLLHAQAGKDFYSLEPVSQRAFDYYGVNL